MTAVKRSPKEEQLVSDLYYLGMAIRIVAKNHQAVRTLNAYDYPILEKLEDLKRRIEKQLEALRARSK